MSTCDEICCLLSTGKNGDSFEKFEFFFLYVRLGLLLEALMRLTVPAARK